MKNNTKRIAAMAMGLIIAFVLTGCSLVKLLDVVGQQSVTSFDEVLKTIPDKVAVDEANSGWALTAPDDSVRFIWSEDYSRAPLYDIMLEFDAQPFLDAGLDPEGLPHNYAFYEGGTMDGMNSQMMRVGTKLGDGELTYSGNPTALEAYEQLVDKYRSSINYHAEFDHYGVMLGDGNMFEWAKDLLTNEVTNENQNLDIVFVLNPEPLIAAGVDQNNVEGWVYAPVEMMVDGKNAEVYKFLKSFDIK